MEKKKLPNIEITELYLVKADWNRTFIAEIRSEKNENGKPVFIGSVAINEGKIWSAGESLDEVGNYLDDICTMKLDYNLHASTGESVVFARTSFSLQLMSSKLLICLIGIKETSKK